MREQVQRDAAAQAEGRNGSERAVDIGEGRLQPEREQDDPATIGRCR